MRGIGGPCRVKVILFCSAEGATATHRGSTLPAEQIALLHFFLSMLALSLRSSCSIPLNGGRFAGLRVCMRRGTRFGEPSTVRSEHASEVLQDFD
jgi:hypothetical protein